MKWKSIQLFLFFWLYIFYGQAQTNELKNFGDNPGNLRAYIHSPENLSDTMSYPLVIVLHGCSQNASEVEEQSGWSVLADSNRFFVLYPEQKRINNANNCFNWFLKSDNQKDKGEIASVYNMMRKVCDSLSVDTSSVFVYGLSAGAMMSVSMLACYPAYFQAGAVLAGGPYSHTNTGTKALRQMISPEELTASQRAAEIRKQSPLHKGDYPKLIVMHGRKDKVVDYKNALELIKQWNGLYSQDLSKKETRENYTGIQNLSRVSYAYEYDKDVEIIFYSLPDAGHTLPVDPGKGPKQGGKTGMFAADLDFFSTWYIADDFGLLKNQH